MPIYGLTDHDNISRSLPEIARMYKGEEKEKGSNRPGKDLEYFRVEFAPEFAHLKPLWEEMYGDKPVEFQPMFLVGSTVHDAFATWKEEWNGSGTMLHRCSGAAPAGHEDHNREQVIWWNDQTKIYMTARVKCAAPTCECKITGRLSFVLPDFVDATGVLGTISVTTHSFNDIQVVYSYLMLMYRKIGTLAGIPFVFGRAAHEISAPKQQKVNGDYQVTGRIRVEKSLFFLRATADYTHEVLMPVLSGAPRPMLTEPAQAPQPQLQPRDITETAARLGTGTDSRRIGGDVTIKTVTGSILQLDPEQPALPAVESAPEPVIVTTTDPEPAPHYLTLPAHKNALARLFLELEPLTGKTSKELAALALDTLGIASFTETTLPETELHTAIRNMAAALMPKAEPKAEPKRQNPYTAAVNAALNANDPPVQAFDETKIDNPVIVEHVRYVKANPTAYLEFYPRPWNTNLSIRVYGRSSSFKEMVGDAYYNANGFENMAQNTDQPIAVAPLSITWQIKGSDNYRYRVNSVGGVKVVEPEPETPGVLLIDGVPDEEDLEKVPF